MNITDKNQNRFFWILQFAGWGFLNLSSVFFLKRFGIQFVIFNLINGLTIGIGVTTGLRSYLKRNIDLESFTFKKSIKITVALLVAGLVYGALNYAMGYAYHKFGPDISEEQLNLLRAFDNKWLLLFNSVFIIACWVICYLVIKLLLKLNKDRIARLEMSDTLKQAQLNTLKGQINPHFMFNSLNNIRGLMLEDVEKSREMLTKLSEMLRYSLTKNNVDGIAVAEELEMVDNYIALSKIQFEDRLQYIKKVDDTALAVQIPPMLIQLLIENAAKHGIANLKDGGEIRLEIQKYPQEMLIRVTNTGKLKISKGSTQLGLRNIRQRLKLLHGDNATFSLNEVGNEVAAEIHIPI